MRLSRRFADQTRRFYGVGETVELVLPVFVFSPIPKRSVTENLVCRTDIGRFVPASVRSNHTPAVHQKKPWLRPSRVRQFFDPSPDFSLVEPSPVSGLYTRGGGGLQCIGHLRRVAVFPVSRIVTCFDSILLSECDTTTIRGWSVVFDTRINFKFRSQKLLKNHMGAHQKRVAFFKKGQLFIGSFHYGRFFLCDLAFFCTTPFVSKFLAVLFVCGDFYRQFFFFTKKFIL